MKLGITLKASLQQSLTPQQIQYLKMLQLPLLQLEQHVRAEIENNPMLEEGSDYEADTSSDASAPDAEPTVARAESTAAEDAASAVVVALQCLGGERGDFSQSRQFQSTTEVRAAPSEWSMANHACS